jgi:hypothetical protein
MGVKMKNREKQIRRANRRAVKRATRKRIREHKVNKKEKRGKK